MIWQALSALDRHCMRRLGGPHLNTLAVYGTWRCRHRSHRLGLRCLREWTWGSYCGKHNDECWADCEALAGRRQA